MTVWSCVTCAHQTGDLPAPPPLCLICADDRQYVPPQGQRWTTHEERGPVRWHLDEPEPGLVALKAEPRVGIGQRGLLVRTADGGVLWDPPGYVDRGIVGRLRAGGSVVAVAFSHPHFHGCMVDWGRALDARVLVADADLQWVQRADPVLTAWSGTAEPAPGVTLVQCGGHFPGSAVLHWAAGAGGGGALLVGDTLSVVADRRWLTFMYSYPNDIPLPAPAVHRILAALAPYRFARVYGGFDGADVPGDGEAAVARSARRYLRAIGAPVPPIGHAR